MAEIATIGPATATVSPKIKNINDGAKFAKDFMSNPPQNPAEFLKVMGSTLDFGGALSAGIGAVFPLALPVLPILSGIFDLFGGSGPSIGQVTLDAIGKVSEQISQGFKAVSEQIETVATQQATRTIETVLSGVDTLAREQSAAQVFETFAAQNILAETEAKKLEIFADYTNAVNSERQAFVTDVSETLKKAQEQSNAEFAVMQAQVASIAGDVLTPIAAALEQAQADATELADLQRQIDEISDLIKSGQLAAIAKTLVKQYLRIP